MFELQLRAFWRTFRPMKTLILLLTATALSGCLATGPVHMVKAGASTSDFESDYRKCDYEATVATQATTPGMRSMIGEEIDRAMRKRDLMVRCLSVQGWRPS